MAMAQHADIGHFIPCLRNVLTLACIGGHMPSSEPAWGVSVAFCIGHLPPGYPGSIGHLPLIKKVHKYGENQLNSGDP